jgi:hypothetical protein
VTPEQRRMACVAVLEALDELEFRHPATIAARSGLDDKVARRELAALSRDGLAERQYLIAQTGWYEYRRTRAGTAELARLKEATRSDG